MKKIYALNIIFLLYATQSYSSANQSHSMNNKQHDNRYTLPLLPSASNEEEHPSYQTNDPIMGQVVQHPSYQTNDPAAQEHHAHYTIVLSLQPTANNQTQNNQEPAPHVITQTHNPITNHQLHEQQHREAEVYYPIADNRLYEQRRRQAENAAERRNCKFGCCCACILITTVVGGYMIVNEIENHKIWTK